MRILALTAALAACGGGGGSTDIRPTLKFADRSDAELARLISAAGGTDMFGAEAQLSQFSDSTDPCPAAAITGNQVTLTGGCTTTGGVQLGGAATIINPTGWTGLEYNYAAETSYDLQALTLTQSGFTQSYDGVFHITNNFRTYDADLTVDQQAINVRSDIHYECDTSSCSLSGSGIELVAVGGAKIGRAHV